MDFWGLHFPGGALHVLHSGPVIFTDRKRTQLPQDQLSLASSISETSGPRKSRGEPARGLKREVWFVR